MLLNHATHEATAVVCSPFWDSDLYNGHMPRMMTATEVKAKILALLDEVATGEEVEITKHGHIVARLVPASGPPSLKGELKGVARTAAAEQDLFSTGVAWELR
jgi:prevent-host-death family protein